MRNKAGFQFLVSLFFLHSPTIFESKCNATNTFQEGSSCTHTLFRPFRPCLWRQDFNLAFKNIVIVRLRNVDIHVFQWILIIEQIKIKNRSCKTLPRGAVLLCKVRFQWTHRFAHTGAFAAACTCRWTPTEQNTLDGYGDTSPGANNKVFPQMCVCFYRREG